MTFDPHESDLDADGVARFQTRRRLPFWPIIYTLLTVFVFVLWLIAYRSDDPKRPALEDVLICLFPFSLAVAGWRSRMPMVVGEIADGKLTLEREGEIPIDRMRAVLAPDYKPNGKRDQKFPIFIHDDHGGMITLPRRLTLPSVYVFQKLASLLPPSGSRSINPILGDYLTRNEDDFGADRIFSYVAFKGRMKEVGGRRGMLNYGVALLLTGLIFLVMVCFAESDSTQSFFGGIAALALFVGLMLTVLSKSSSGAILNRKLLDSSLVITPLGLALVQEDLRGELIWSQVLDVVYPQKTKNWHFTLARRSSTTRELIVKVDGADIPILDIYDRPLSVIHEQIVRYWRPRFDAAAFDPTARPESPWREEKVGDEIDL